MRLLFAYFDYTGPRADLSSDYGLGPCELNLSTSHEFHVSREPCATGGDGVCTYELTYEPKPKRKGEQLPAGFWGERISSLTAFVGENGAGKSTLLIGIIKSVVSGLDPGVPYILVIQRTECRQLVLFHSRGINFSVARGPSGSIDGVEITSDYPSELRETKVILVDNSLTLASVDLDIEYSGSASALDAHTPHPYRPAPVPESYKQLYNKSLAASIRFSDATSNAGQPIDRNVPVIDELESHFRYESYQQARYLFDPFSLDTIKAVREEGLPFPCPTYLYVHAYSVKQLYDKVEGRLEMERRPTRPYPTACDCVSGAGFLGLLLAHALYIIYNACAGTVYSDSIGRLFTDPELPDSPAPSFESARSIAENILQKTSLALNPTSWFPDAKREAIRHCHDFIRFILQNDDLLNDILLTAPGQDALTRRIDIQGVLDDPERLRCMWGFLGYYRLASESDYFLLFSSGLSSGEKSLLQLFTHFRYALDGPVARLEDSKPGDFKPNNLTNWFPTENGKHEEVTCDTLLLLLDEADLTFHPEWQRQYVCLLTAILPRMFRDPYEVGKPEGCKDIQVILTTHSPLMLSDIPRQSCIFLAREGRRNVVAKDLPTRKTFGTNVQDLLRSAFFLKRTIGEFARDKIVEEVYADLKALANHEDGANPERCRQHRRVIDMIGDPILHNKLLVLYNRCFPAETAVYELRNLEHRAAATSSKDRKMLISSLERTLHKLQQLEGDEN